MGGHKTSEEVREQHLRDMGAELGAVFNAISNDVIWLHAKWNQYTQLYAHSAERIALLNAVAGHFFAMLQQTLLEDIILHLARLTDPPKSSGKANLTLQRLPLLISDPRLASDVKGLVEDALLACKSSRAWRNRRLAHRDLDLALSVVTDPLPGISRADIKAALGAVRAVLHRLETHFWNSETAHELVLVSGGEADSMIHYLHRGLRAEESRMERLRQGNPLPEDIQRKGEL